MSKQLRIAFVHLDLGMGGAERLVVSAAHSLKKCGHNVCMYTTYHDINRAFPQTYDGSLDVRVYGQWIPSEFLGKFRVLFSTIRMIYLAIRLILSGDRYDVIFNDQIPTVNPLLRFCSSCLVFYCHFPDLLLCDDRRGIFNKIYRFVFDKLEQYFIGESDALFINSHFTEQVVRDTFHSLKSKQLYVLYPPIDLEEAENKTKTFRSVKFSQIPEIQRVDEDIPYFLSINRYDKKKHIRLAVDAFHYLKEKLWSENDFNLNLVIAGGYDSRVPANAECFRELEQLISEYKLNDNVILLRNVSDDSRWHLLMKSACVIYTPKFEHFGIVPCEAMAVGTPVIASNSGGPKETVVNNQTGYLCEHSAEEFANAMMKIIHMQKFDNNAMQAMKKAAIRRVMKKFSLESFATDLYSKLVNVFEEKKSRKNKNFTFLN